MRVRVIVWMDVSIKWSEICDTYEEPAMEANDYRTVVTFRERLRYDDVG